MRLNLDTLTLFKNDMYHEPFDFSQSVDEYAAERYFFHVLGGVYEAILKLTPFFHRYSFVTKCVPWYILHRLNEYFYGPVILGLAAERYIMVVYPFRAKALLTTNNRETNLFPFKR